MTGIRSPVTRLTASHIRERGLRPLVVTLYPGYMMIRPKGLRRGLSIDYVTIYQKAAQIESARMRQEKAEAKKARKQKGKRS